MEMEFRRGQYQQAEKQMIRAQEHDRTVDDLAEGYEKLAKQVISDDDGAVRDEVARFSRSVMSKQGAEQLDELQKLAKAVKLRRSSVFEYVPDDEADHAAFALALVHAHGGSLQ